jgi:Transposase DDE domain
MSVNALYATWFQFLSQLLPAERITRVRNLAALISGIAQSRSVFLSHIADHLPGKAKAPSLTRRLDRFLENHAFAAQLWYEPLACHLLSGCGSQQAVVLILDGTKVGFYKQRLGVALATHHRALPLAWSWVAQRRGHSRAAQHLALLTQVQRRLPLGARVILVGDAEFGSGAVVKQLHVWGWQYVLRERGRMSVRPHAEACWAPFRRLVTAAGQSIWKAQWLCWEQHPVCTNLIAHWGRGEETPWLLLTNLPAKAAALHAYRRRMWIEEMFGDMKGHGFDLEGTHLQDADKLSRLTFAVFVLYLSLITRGVQVMRYGQRHLVDRRDRRDLSVFRLGWRMLQRHWHNGLELSIALNPFVP